MLRYNKITQDVQQSRLKIRKKKKLKIRIIFVRKLIKDFYFENNTSFDVGF